MATHSASKQRTEGEGGGSGYGEDEFGEKGAEDFLGDPFGEEEMSSRPANLLEWWEYVINLCRNYTPLAA